MKNLLLTICILLSASGAFAQESKYSVVTNSFFNNTFVTVGSGYNIRNADFHLAVGKWFTPSIAFRVKGTYCNARMESDLQNCGSTLFNNKVFLLNAETMFNLTNMFMGYRENRVYSFIPFVSGGLARTCTFNHNGLNFGFGLINSIRLSQRCLLDLEVANHRYDNGFSGSIFPRPYEFRKKENWSLELGLTIKLGSTKGWSKAPDAEAIRAGMQAELDALNAQLEDERMENQRLQEELEKARNTEK